jgi:hypothetical protein
MIHGMKAVHAVTLLLLCLANLPRAGAMADLPLAPPSTPELQVRVFGFPGLSAWTLNGAETEATRMLRPVHIELAWVDCTSRTPPAACVSPRTPTDLIVRFVAKALPQASGHALGIAGSSDGHGVAFVFYDRVAGLRTHSRLLPAMLGRVMAHEITHLLLPDEKHAGVGLMRGQWAADDLQITSSTCLGLPAASVHFMEKEALRRVMSRLSAQE